MYGNEYKEVVVCDTSEVELVVRELRHAQNQAVVDRLEKCLRKHTVLMLLNENVLYYEDIDMFVVPYYGPVINLKIAVDEDYAIGWG